MEVTSTMIFSHDPTHTHLSQSRETLAQKALRLIDIFIRIILHPLRIVMGWFFRGEFDGLEDAVTAKAAQQFVSFLSLQTTTPDEKGSINEIWSTNGFNATKDEALQSHSLLLVYLHSPLHRSTSNTIRTLLHPRMMEFLNQPYVKALGVSIHTGQGSALASMLGAVSYPLLAVLQPQSSSTLNLVFIAQGGQVLDSMPASQLVQSLDTCLQRHMISVNEAEHRRLAREQEVELRRQQDAEYEEALEADRQRERQQREAELVEQRRIEEEARLEREAEEAAENKLNSARALLREEPSSGGCMIRFQLPSGAKVNRRFESDETIGTLKAFLFVHFTDNEIEITNVGLSTNFPRQSYTDESQSLEEAGLVPQAVIMVQDLDA